MTLDEMEAQYRQAVAAMQALEKQLAMVRRDDPAREGVKADLAAAVARVRGLKEKQKELSSKRNFAGLGSPLHEALVARLDPALVGELEVDAMTRLAEREARTAARRAEKQARAAAAPPAEASKLEPPPAPPPAKANPHRTRRAGPVEVIHLARSRALAPPADAPSAPPGAPMSRGPDRQREIGDVFRSARRLGT